VEAITIVEPPLWGSVTLDELVGLTFFPIQPKAGQVLKGAGGIRRLTIRDFAEYYFVDIDEFEKKCSDLPGIAITGYGYVLLDKGSVMIPKACCAAA
jgi:hypothetical protein